MTGIDSSSGQISKSGCSSESYSGLKAGAKLQMLLIMVAVHLFFIFPLSEKNNAAFAATPRIVVLGSSTAAGAGPKDPANAWVNRYRSYWQSIKPDPEVINLAVGGYTTYKIMPTGFVPPPSRPAPDPAANITAALALNPQAVIINMPSNDAASGYSVAEQLSNYDGILAEASAAGVPVWISTTQPRNLSVAGRRNLIAMRDSTFARFGNMAIDFWTGLASENGRILEIYDSGDGVHLNDAAHRILFERAAHKTVEPLFNAVPFNREKSGLGQMSDEAATISQFQLQQNYPNPFNPSTTIEYVVQAAGEVELAIYNVLGEKVRTLVNERVEAGTHQVQWHGSDDTGKQLGSGVYFYRVKTATGSAVKELMLVK